MGPSPVFRYRVTDRGLLHDGRAYSPGDVAKLPAELGDRFTTDGAVNLVVETDSPPPSEPIVPEVAVDVPPPSRANPPRRRR